MVQSVASWLTLTQRYAAGALFAMALRLVQIYQTEPLGSSFLTAADEDDADVPDGRNNSSSRSSESGNPQLWTHESRGLLRRVFSFLGIDRKAWPGIEETAASSPAGHHVGAFLRIIFEENKETSSENLDQELALSKAVDAMVMSMESSSSSETAREEKYRYENQCREKAYKSVPVESPMTCDTMNLSNAKTAPRSHQPNDVSKESPLLGDIMKNYQRKVAVLYELLSACLADSPESPRKQNTKSHLKGYDSRHRAALRLLCTWFDVEWKKFEAMEVMVACSAMAALKSTEEKVEDGQSTDSTWSKWKRGGIIGAAALTGGTLLAITGGLAAPAIAAGVGALAPTLGTLVPVIGASGFAAAASAAGSVAGSVAVAASFGAAGAGLSGSKMARRIGGVEEFEFKTLGKNHHQGHLAVGILVSGFIFEDQDYILPWEHAAENLERYALQWESEVLIAVSNAIQDWITSTLTTELMKRGAMLTVLSTLVTALAWPTALLQATSFIDSKWTIAVDRSDKAGKLLAEVLTMRLQGNRPVTLVGFSLGARVIFKCLQFLAESGDNAEGLVERVVLLGAPIPMDGEPWESARKIVAGRFINVYSTNDWILGVTFRANLLTQGLAGIQPVDIPGIENVDVTEYIDGHSSYLWTTQNILAQLELESCYPVFSCSSA